MVMSEMLLVVMLSKKFLLMLLLLPADSFFIYIDSAITLIASGMIDPNV